MSHPYAQCPWRNDLKVFLQEQDTRNESDRNFKRNNSRTIKNNILKVYVVRDFPGGTVDKNLPSSAGDMGLIFRLGISYAGGGGNPLQYYFLGNPMNSEAWQATVHVVTKESDTT